ncbi:ATP synthase subunit I [Aeromonas sobria]|jgi:ATP synthase protein I|uniref:ATP synthase subunit I n=1 Tax=Aeromonas sobria TaxID=646 RepID=UPI001396B6DE|nr:ATP synthase subunit I [Aeromonas sobria]HEH9440342.1 ATP synthase subunit I [Aeromonas sobria]
MFRGRLVKQKLALEGLTLALVMLVCQLILILAMSAIWYYQSGARAGYSALYGGGMYWVPQALFTVWVLRRKVTAESVGLVLRDFYGGAGIKLISTAGLFALLFGAGVEVVTVSFFATYILALVVQWMVSFTLNNHY